MSQNDVKDPVEKQGNNSNEIDTNEEVDKQEILEKYDKQSKIRDLDNRKFIFWTLFIIAALYSVYHLWIQFNPMPALQQRSIHVAVGLALIFLIYPTFASQNRNKVPFYDWILFGLSFYSSYYILTEYTAIVTERGGIPNTMDIIVGIMTVLLILEAARRVTGLFYLSLL